MWSAVSHFLSFTLGTIAGVTLMCLLQAGRQADEQFKKGTQNHAPLKASEK